MSTLFKHPELPFSVTTDSQLKYPNGSLANASPEILLLAVLIKEIQTLNENLTVNTSELVTTATELQPIPAPTSTPTPTSKK